MSVKQELEYLKDSLERLPPEDKEFIQGLIPVVGPHIPRLAATLEKIPNILGVLMSVAMSAATQAGRERITKAAKEVFGV